MAFENVRRTALATHGDLRKNQAPGAAAIAYLSEALPLKEAGSIAEINPAGLELASELSARSSARYHGIHYGPGEPPGPSPSAPGISWVYGSGTGEIPLPDQSQDILLSCHALDGVRLDFLYMVCSEARRVTKISGLWVVLSRDPGKKGSLTRLLSRFGKPRLDFSHYISPEDWETVEDIYLRPQERLFILKRIPSPA